MGEDAKELFILFCTSGFHLKWSWFKSNSSRLTSRSWSRRGFVQCKDDDSWESWVELRTALQGRQSVDFVSGSENVSAGHGSH